MFPIEVLKQALLSGRSSRSINLGLGSGLCVKSGVAANSRNLISIHIQI